MSLTGALLDLARGRIFNWLTFPAMALGLIACGVLGGWSCLGDAALGLGAGFALYGWMFWFGHMGAGDVKLLMALGAWGGLRYSVEVGLLGIAVGGVIAAILLVVTGRIKGFLLRMRRFVLSLFVKELVLELPKVDRTFTMPYGVPIAIAAVWTALGDPFARWGGHPW